MHTGSPQNFDLGLYFNMAAL